MRASRSARRLRGGMMTRVTNGGPAGYCRRNGGCNCGLTATRRTAGNLQVNPLNTRRTPAVETRRSLDWTQLAWYHASMKATIDFDDALYRRLKIEAARRGRTVRDLVADGVRLVLDAPATTGAGTVTESPDAWRPPWFGALARYGRAVDEHAMSAVRESIALGRSRDRTR